MVASLSSSCDGDDKVTPASCENGISNYTAALNAYIADIENVSKCQALKETLDDLIDCPGITAGQRAEYQAEVDGHRLPVTSLNTPNTHTHTPIF